MSHQYQQQPTSGQYGQHGQTERSQGGRPMQSQGGGPQSQMQQAPSRQHQPSMQSGGMQSGGMQQSGMQPQQMRGGMPQQQQFEDHLTNDLRIALDDFNDVSHIAEWCAKECVRSGPQMATCARICTDLAELAELNERWIARDSMFGPDLAEEFIRIATEALPELEQYQQSHPHVGETIGAITRAIESCQTVLQMTGQGSTSQEMPQSGAGGQMGGGQMGGGQMGGGQMSGGQMSGGQQPMGGQQF